MWIAVGVIVPLVLGAVLYWRIRRRRRSRMIAFVALLREPAPLDPAVLARLAGKAWNADLNDWCYVNSQGDLVGCYTVAAVKEVSRRARK
jgi:hypothetical protein